MDNDWLIGELRKAFAQIDVTAAEEAEKEEKRIRKAARAARRAEKRSSPPKLENASKSERLTKCRDCGKPTKADDELYFIPVQCNHCQELSKSIDLGIHPRSPVEFSSVHIVPGGAPGLGRRK